MSIPALALGVAIGLAAAPVSPSSPPVCDHPGGDLVHHWPGDGDAEDSAGDADGTVSGATFAAGNIRQAFNFDGSDDNVSFGATAGSFGTSDFTVSYWIRTVNTTEKQGVLGNRVGCQDGGFWDSRLRADGKIDVELRAADENDYNAAQTSTAMNDGAFHLFALVRQGAELRLYVDGVLDGSNSIAGTTDLSSTANLVAGRSGCTGLDGTADLAGQLDEIRIYDRALSACEIVVGAHHRLDVDFDGAVGPLSDMLLLMRYFFGFRGATLVNGAVGAKCLRCDTEDIEAYLDSL